MLYARFAALLVSYYQVDLTLGTGFPDLFVLQVEPLLRGGDRLHDHWDLSRGHCRPGHPDALREKEGLHSHACQILNCKDAAQK